MRRPAQARFRDRFRDRFRLRLSRRFTLALAACASIAALCGAWATARGPEVAATGPVSIQTLPVPLDRDDPAREQVGALVWRGGVQLLSESPGFGGYSGLRLLPDGRLLAVSDRGHWLAFRPVEDAGRLVGLAEAVQGPLPGKNGQPLNYPDYDAEALEVLPGAAGGYEILVAFEQRHRIWRYAGPQPQSRPEQAFSQPPTTIDPTAPGDPASPDSASLDRWLEGWPGRLPANAGLEAMAVSRTGAALLLAEGTGEGRLRLHADAPWVSIRYNSAPGFKPTDAVFLPVEGRHLALVLSRYFSILHGVAATLELVDLERVEDGVLPGRLLARLAPPISVDNMEGVAAAPAPTGETGWDIYLLADDNQNPLQRTLLLKFRLPAAVVDP